MVEIEFLDYDEKTHKTDYLNMFLEYGKGLDEQVVNTYGYHLIPEGNIKKLAERLVPQFTSYDKSEELLLILKIDGKTAFVGMGILSS
jgi:predicted component of type VI protein secretion system